MKYRELVELTNHFDLSLLRIPLWSGQLTNIIYIYIAKLLYNHKEEA
jgi:hypothetical protein